MIPADSLQRITGHGAPGAVGGNGVARDLGDRLCAGSRQRLIALEVDLVDNGQYRNGALSGAIILRRYSRPPNP